MRSFEGGALSFSLVLVGVDGLVAFPRSMGVRLGMDLGTFEGDCWVVLLGVCNVVSGDW